MTNSIAVQLGDAIKAALIAEVYSSSSSFSQTFEPKRQWMADLEKAQEGELQVTIVPRADSWDRVSRGAASHTYTIAIDVRRSIDPRDPAEVDQLAKLVEEITDLLGGQMLTVTDGGTSVSASNLSITIDPLYDEQAIYDSQQFISQIAATYVLHRAIA